MATVSIDGKTVEVDEEGYLLNLTQWDEAVANAFAAKEGMSLTPAHWEVITFLREYYAEFQIAPMIRVLTKAIGKKLGPEKGNNKYLYQLFPEGPAKQACKYAGLPKPPGCV